ncbi:MAG: S8 family serine peptidase [Janthinobacterium lividum]
MWEALEFQVDAGGTKLRPIVVPLVRTGGTSAFSVITPEAGAPISLVKAGRPANVQTIVYVHGIGNKPPASVLRCQWDTALFGHSMGDRSRMAYWVDRDRFPRPADGTCGDGDLVIPDDDQASTAAIMALTSHTKDLAGPEREAEAIDRTIDALTKDDDKRAVLRSIAAKCTQSAIQGAAEVGAGAPGTTNAKIIPLPEPLRQALAALLTRNFLPDVNDFLFNAAKCNAMTDALSARLRSGGQPFIVVAHSQGSMIAYDVLRRLKKKDCDVALFVTIGSPLGLQEVEDFFQKDGGTLTVPDCVSAWYNFADRLDPVAIDPELANDYRPNADGVAIQDTRVVNLDSPLHPHSGTGYLALPEVRRVVRQAAGIAFVQPISNVIVTRDVVNTAEDQLPHETQEVLIQLSDMVDGGVPRDLSSLAAELVKGLREIALENGRILDEPDLLRRFVVANLTQFELEGLRTLSEQLNVKQVWANASKRALIADSVATLQVAPARLGYGATGAGINWAVLDTGIDDGHRHFAAHGNVRAQWDCTQRGAPRQLIPGDNNDPNGHGTHVAGIIGGGLSDVVFGQRAVALLGMAPEVGLYGYRVLDKDGDGNDAAIIKALDLIATMNEGSSSLLIHGINLSLGSNFDPANYSCGHTPLCQELRRLWRQGVIICLAAGNEGYSMLRSDSGLIHANMPLSISDPANLEEAIAIGSVHKTSPHKYGISYFSSRGPTADGRKKPDLVAPGEKILSALAGGRVEGGAHVAEKLYVEMSGTSMAAPHVSGLLAAFLSVRREFVGDPDRVKEILLGACTDLKRDPNMQGAGLPNLVRMVLET